MRAYGSKACKPNSHKSTSEMPSCLIRAPVSPVIGKYVMRPLTPFLQTSLMVTFCQTLLVKCQFSRTQRATMHLTGTFDSKALRTFMRDIASGSWIASRHRVGGAVARDRDAVDVTAARTCAVRAAVFSGSLR